MTNPVETFGKRLKWLRQRFAKSLEDFGLPHDVGASYLSKLERGDSTTPSGMLIDAICRNLYVNREWLVEGRGKPFLVEEFNEFADSDKVIPWPVPDRIWLPFTDSYVDQIKQLAVEFRNYAAQMAGRAESLEKQARDFEAIQKERRQEQARKLKLPDAETSSNFAEVKAQLPSLLERLRKATAETGKKSELAEFLAKVTKANVPLASVSRWLSGEREPGGEIALQLDAWATAQGFPKGK